MQASELIEKLQDIVARHGQAEVVCSCGSVEPMLAENVEYKPAHEVTSRISGERVKIPASVEIY